MASLSAARRLDLSSGYERRVPGSEEQRRELIELLNELRVALPGVQGLAFLLAVPFANGFPKLGKLDRDIFLAAFIATALSTVFLIAPSSYHRLRWREHDKERLLMVSNVATIIGLALLAVAITGTVFVITDFVFQRAPLRAAYIDRKR
jgi:Family of unknown function (DUF6328)